MLFLTCPACGFDGDEREFIHGGEAGMERPSAKLRPGEAVRDSVYVRSNPKGPHREIWRCEIGCGKWFEVERDTATLAILRTRLPGGRWAPAGEHTAWSAAQE